MHLRALLLAALVAPLALAALPSASASTDVAVECDTYAPPPGPQMTCYVNGSGPLHCGPCFLLFPTVDTALRTAVRTCEMADGTGATDLHERSGDRHACVLHGLGPVAPDAFDGTVSACTVKGPRHDCVIVEGRGSGPA